MDFKRILLKVSGEALGGDSGTGIDSSTVKMVAAEIAGVVKSGVQVAVVMGAGNFFRGVSGVASGMDRVAADQMGMIATLMNAVALKDAIDNHGHGAEVLSAITVGPVAHDYNARLGRDILDSGKVVLCAAGTGNPYFTTDTAGVLRALELNCDAMFKATMVDGVYDSDPLENPGASRFSDISYDEVISRDLRVMDLTAVTLARQGDLPLLVFRLSDSGTMMKLVSGELDHGTLVHS